MPPVAHTSAPASLLAGLAGRDLLHESLLNFCLIVALTAVLTPLLLLLGLKFGVVESLRLRLLEDPVYRELRPAQTLTLEQEWFSQMAQRDDVAFVVPTILRGSSIVSVKTADAAEFVSLDLLPSAAGDVLLLSSGAKIPAADEAVLSAPAAQRLQAEPGERLSVRVTRRRDGRFENVIAQFEVIAILSPQADRLERIYTAQDFVSDVETYREGRSVPARNWSGGAATPFFSFDGVFVITEERLDRISELGLTIATGFTDSRVLDTASFHRRIGFIPSKPIHVIDVYTRLQPVQWSSIDSLRNKLRGRNAALLPYVSGLTLQLSTAAGVTADVSLIGLSPLPRERELLGLSALPWEAAREDTPYAEYAHLLLPESHPLADATEVLAKIAYHSRILQFPLQLGRQSFCACAIAPIELVGALRTGAQRALAFDAMLHSLVLQPPDFSGFRLYARSIDDVPALHRELQAAGIDTIAQVQAIERLQVLDRSLSRIFWLIAVVGISGGVTALIASLYAAVERKQSAIAMLRLMGLARREVAWFPLLQAGIVAAAVIVLSILGFLLLAYSINMSFAEQLELGESICRLPPMYLFIAGILTFASALLSSLAAVWRTTTIDPAEAIRFE